MRIPVSTRFYAFCFAAAICCFGASSSHAAIVFVEPTDGELSGTSTSPTNLGPLFAGSHNVVGGTVSSPAIDRDFWTFTVPVNHQLSSITLAAFSNSDNRSFFAVASGSSLSAINNADLLLGGTFVGDAAGRLVGDNLLDDLAARVHIGGTPRFSGPLGPGAYTFWSQETQGTVTYNYQFNITAVPEPSSIALVACAVGSILFRRKRFA